MNNGSNRAAQASPMRTAWAALVAQGKKSEGDFNMNQPEFVDIPAKTYMSEQEFIAHMDELIPTPSVETNNNLLDLANSLLCPP